MSPLSRETVDRIAEAVHAATLTPSADDLATAPFLDEWFAVGVLTGRPLLVGMATGHPTTGNKEIHTSAVLKIDLEAGYARTQSRWYRLGRPRAETQPEEMAKMREHQFPAMRILEGEDLIAAVSAELERAQAELSSVRPDA